MLEKSNRRGKRLHCSEEKNDDSAMLSRSSRAEHCTILCPESWCMGQWTLRLLSHLPLLSSSSSLSVVPSTAGWPLADLRPQSETSMPYLT